MKPQGLYFRTKENGAFVYRVDTENRQRRLELDHIATINVRNAVIKPHGNATLTEQEEAEITAWITQRQETLAQRQIEDIKRAIDTLCHTAHWVQTKATDAEINTFSGELLMAMHDLRSAIVRRKSDQLKDG